MYHASALLTISPNEASGLAAFTSARFAFEKYMNDDFGFFGALGSRFFFLVPSVFSTDLVPVCAMGERLASASWTFGGTVTFGGCF